MNIIRSITCALALCLLAGANTLFAQNKSETIAQIERDLLGPVTLLLDNGNRQTGRVVVWDGEKMRLSVQLGGGSAEMTFTADQIRDVALPGNEHLELLNQWTADPNRTEDALALFRAYYKQRGPYLQFMDENELGLLVRYARFCLEKNEPLTAIAVINVLRPHIEDEALLKSLDDSILLGFFLGGLREDAQKQAREWIESADPAGPSALGWRILAEIYFLDEEYETAFWTALQPVAFGNQLPTEHIEACYAFAIASAEKTRKEEVMLRLLQEMRDLTLNWPEDIPTLAGLEPILSAAPEAVETEIESPTQSETPETENPAEESASETEPAAPTSKPATTLPSRLPQL